MEARNYCRYCRNGRGKNMARECLELLRASGIAADVKTPVDAMDFFEETIRQRCGFAPEWKLIARGLTLFFGVNEREKPMTETNDDAKIAAFGRDAQKAFAEP
jgi:hypothetical protein